MKTLPAADARTTRPSTDDRLVLVQDGRVVCVVGRHREQAVHSVARLLCRLLVSEVCIYTCPETCAAGVAPGETVAPAPAGWSELCRVRPWAEDLIAIH